MAGCLCRRVAGHAQDSNGDIVGWAKAWDTLCATMTACPKNSPRASVFTITHANSHGESSGCGSCPNTLASRTRAGPRSHKSSQCPIRPTIRRRTSRWLLSRVPSQTMLASGFPVPCARGMPEFGFNVELPFAVLTRLALLFSTQEVRGSDDGGE